MELKYRFIEIERQNSIIISKYSLFLTLKVDEVSI